MRRVVWERLFALPRRMTDNIALLLCHMPWNDKRVEPAASSWAAVGRNSTRNVAVSLYRFLITLRPHRPFDDISTLGSCERHRIRQIATFVELKGISLYV